MSCTALGWNVLEYGPLFPQRGQWLGLRPRQECDEHNTIRERVSPIAATLNVPIAFIVGCGLHRVIWTWPHMSAHFRTIEVIGCVGGLCAWLCDTILIFATDPVASRHAAYVFFSFTPLLVLAGLAQDGVALSHLLLFACIHGLLPAFFWQQVSLPFMGLHITVAAVPAAVLTRLPVRTIDDPSDNSLRAYSALTSRACLFTSVSIVTVVLYVLLQSPARTPSGDAPRSDDMFPQLVAVADAASLHLEDGAVAPHVHVPTADPELRGG
mmetsp:Transcript_60160/g.167872  ORF Transcript_60160/g.167872 Transcript_60160/m.167872 type:complete len:268 (+) Transcript_60160:96-899(+)